MWCNFPGVGLGGEEEFLAGMVIALPRGSVEGVDEFSHGDLGEVAPFGVEPFLVLFLKDSPD